MVCARADCALEYVSFSGNPLCPGCRNKADSTGSRTATGSGTTHTRTRIETGTETGGSGWSGRSSKSPGNTDDDAHNKADSVKDASDDGDDDFDALLNLALDACSHKLDGDIEEADDLVSEALSEGRSIADAKVFIKATTMGQAMAAKRIGRRWSQKAAAAQRSRGGDRGA